MSLSDRMEKAVRLFCLPRCVSCGELLQPQENGICGSCRLTYENGKLQNCSVCFQRISRCTCVPHRLETHYMHRLVKVTRYTPDQETMPSSALIFALKDDYRQDVFDFIADEMVEAISVSVKDPSECLFTNVPRRRAAVLENGYDHAGILAQELAKRLGGTYMSLLRSRAKHQQKGMRANERLRNAAFALRFRFRKADLTGKHVIVVDDIVTTGASMAAASVLLHSLGAKEIIGATYAIAYRDAYEPFSHEDRF